MATSVSDGFAEVTIAHTVAFTVAEATKNKTTMTKAKPVYQVTSKPSVPASSSSATIVSTVTSVTTDTTTMIVTKPVFLPARQKSFITTSSSSSTMSTDTKDLSPLGTEVEKHRDVNCSFSKLHDHIFACLPVHASSSTVASSASRQANNPFTTIRLALAMAWNAIPSLGKKTPTEPKDDPPSYVLDRARDKVEQKLATAIGLLETYQIITRNQQVAISEHYALLQEQQATIDEQDQKLAAALSKLEDVTDALVAVMSSLEKLSEAEAKLREKGVFGRWDWPARLVCVAYIIWSTVLFRRVVNHTRNVRAFILRP